MSKPFRAESGNGGASCPTRPANRRKEPALTRISLPDGTEIALRLRRSARARRYALRVSRHDGAVTLTLPQRGTEREALRFAQGQLDWIARTLAEIAPPAVVQFGMDLPFEGRPLRLTPARLRAPQIEGDALLAPEDPARLGTRLEAFLKLAARQRLQAATETHAARLGRPFASITLRDTRSRWGSCSHAGALSYNWRLVMAPPAVLDYVAAHEVAHLAEMNHSPAFWAVVAQLCPGYRTERAWLKREGGALQAIRFRD